VKVLRARCMLGGPIVAKAMLQDATTKVWLDAFTTNLGTVSGGDSRKR